MSMREFLPCSQSQAFALRHCSASGVSLSSGTRMSASIPLLQKEDANSYAIARFDLYSENLPSGVLWPAVVLPHQLSMKTFMQLFNRGSRCHRISNVKIILIVLLALNTALVIMNCCEMCTFDYMLIYSWNTISHYDFALIFIYLH